MHFRKAEEKDADSIMNLINQGKKRMKTKGPEQWSDDYPNRKDIENDIKKENSFLLEEGNKTVGTFALDNKNPLYGKIEGKWLNPGHSFCIASRLAIDQNLKGTGIGDIVIQEMERIAKLRGLRSIKASTFETNKPFQNTILRHGFTYCGKISLQQGSSLNAFQKILQPNPAL